jgi:ribosomal protein S18 acetylase RimI-like enzyme
LSTPSSNDVRVRDATPDDLTVIVDYNLRLGAETEDKALSREVLANGVRRGLASPALCRYFIAEIDGRPVGTTMLTYELTDWRNGVIWWLQSVYIDEAFRRSGVVRAIYRHIEDLARRAPDVRALRLYVRHDNERAIRTYEAMGMVGAGYRVLEQEL